MQVVAVDDMSGGFKSNVPGFEDTAGGGVHNTSRNPSVKFVFGDLKDPLFVEALLAQLGPFDTIYHLAAYAAEGLSHFIRSYNYRNNLVASAELLTAAMRHKVRTFVFTSSIAVYGTNQIPMTEATVPIPEDPYGISKYAFELDLRSAHHQFGINFIVFRPHNVYGPHQNIADKYRNVIGIFINQILHNQPLTIFGDGTQTRAFSYISDVAPIIAAGPLVPEALNDVFNIGADTPYTLNVLAAEVSAAMGVPPNVKHLDARNEVMHAQASHRKLHCMFGTGGRFVSLKEGLQKTVEWVRRVGKEMPPVEFEAVEIKRNMPPSWVRDTLQERPRILHTAKASNPMFVDDPADHIEYDAVLPEEKEREKDLTIQCDRRVQAASAGCGM
jgi:UDP-glucose 4-epimerase